MAAGNDRDLFVVINAVYSTLLSNPLCGKWLFALVADPPFVQKLLLW